MEFIEEELIKQAGEAARALVQELKARSLPLVLAESCTAGLIASLLANMPGASAVLWGSFVCYTREAKAAMLGLDQSVLAGHGLVSGETACAMAAGALKKSGAGIAAAVTGIAGPDGDGSNVPVGTVWAAAARPNGETKAREYHFEGSRNAVRLQAAVAVMEFIRRLII